MERLRLAVVALALCCCCCLVVHASSPSPALLSPGLRVLRDRENEDRAALGGADDQYEQAVVAGEAAEAGDTGFSERRMGLGLEDYPGSGANDRHSLWGRWN